MENQVESVEMVEQVSQGRTLRDIRLAELNKLLNSTEGQLLSRAQADNVRYLVQQIENTGFARMFNDEKGEPQDLYKVLMQAVRNGDAEFSLTTKCGVERLDAEAKLYFKFHTKSGRYYWNRYRMSAKPPLSDKHIFREFLIKKPIKKSEVNLPADRERQFIKNQNITSLEALNLLEGRSVCKEVLDENNQIKEEWVALNFKYDKPSIHAPIWVQPVEGYQFDVRDVLKEMPIKDIDKLILDDKFIDSLKKGNAREVVLFVGGKELKYRIGVDARNKTVRFYDNDSITLVKGVEYKELAGKILQDKIASGKIELNGQPENLQLMPLTAEQLGILATRKSICQIHQDEYGADREIWLTLNTKEAVPFCATHILVRDSALEPGLNILQQIQTLPLANPEQIDAHIAVLRTGESQWVDLVHEGKESKIRLRVDALDKEIKMYWPTGNQLTLEEKERLINGSKLENKVETVADKALTPVVETVTNDTGSLVSDKKEQPITPAKVVKTDQALKTEKAAKVTKGKSNTIDGKPQKKGRKVSS